MLPKRSVSLEHPARVTDMRRKRDHCHAVAAVSHVREMMEESIGTGRANLIVATACGCSSQPLQRCELGAINDCQGRANHAGDYKSAKAGPLAQDPNTTAKLSKSIEAGDVPRIPPYSSRETLEDEAKAALTFAKRAGVMRV